MDTEKRIQLITVPILHIHPFNFLIFQLRWRSLSPHNKTYYATEKKKHKRFWKAIALYKATKCRRREKRSAGAKILYIKYLRELILWSVSLLQALKEVSNAKFYALNSL